METMQSVLHVAGMGLGYAAVVLLCLAGLVLSGLSISGTWLVCGAAALAAVLSGDAFPGLWTVVVFLLVSGLVEVAEALAASWGVARRGGSKPAGWAALAGGLLGTLLGSLIPIPLAGSLLGMLAGSFGLAFAVEWQRLKRSGTAADIAMGSVIARVLVILLKVAVTLGMSIVLLVGLVAGRHG